MGTTVDRAATEADLLQAPRDGNKYELVDGRLRMSPAGFRHGQICTNLSAALVGFVRERRLGSVVDSSTGFRLPGGNVRSPDVAFVSRERLTADQGLEGFAPFPPDLAIEVLSPEDRPRDILDKVGEYLGASVRLVWIIDPRGRTATVYRSLTDVHTLRETEPLDGESVLPGFRMALRDVFAE